MLVMTAKVDKKKIAIILAAVILVITMIVMLVRGGSSTPTASTGISNNDARVAFLKSFGWDVTTSPVESSQVRIPEKTTEVFDRYNELQKSQGYDLKEFAGKTATRYVYKVNNYPGATAPVYATILVYKNQVIGGDVTDTSAKGVVRGFKMPAQISQTPTTTVPPTTAASNAA
jgi:hypothetical protein